MYERYSRGCFTEISLSGFSGKKITWTARNFMELVSTAKEIMACIYWALGIPHDFGKQIDVCETFDLDIVV